MVNTIESCTSKVSICQTCGDKGFEDLLLCCSKCQISEEHRYCLAQIPEVDDEDFTYICAKCASSSGNQTSHKKSFGRAPYSVPSPRKKFKKQSIEPAVAIVQDLKSASSVAAEAEVPTIPISSPLETSVAEPLVENVQALHDRNENDSSPSQINQSAALAQEGLTCEANPLQILVCAPPVQDVPLLVDPNESNNIPHCPSNGPFPRSLAGPKYVYAQPIIDPLVENVQALHDRNENDSSPSQINQSAALAQEGPTCEANPLQILVCAPPVQDVPLLVDPNEGNNIPHCPSNGPPPRSLAGPKYVYAQPIIDPAWRGCFQMSEEIFGEFVAHLSDKACLQVVEAAKLMPAVLSARMLPRLEIWPKSFHVSAPTDENIALYFFPESESVVKAFDGLMHNIVNRDLALKVLFDNVELLVFSSSQLPSQYRRFMGKYYLWGVFRGRKDLSSHESGDAHITQDKTGCMPLSALGNTKMCDSEALRMSPLSPLSASGSHSSGSLYSQ